MPETRGDSPPETNANEEILADWEKERTIDLASSTSGRSSRIARRVPRFPPDNSRSRANTTELPGSVSGIRTAEPIGSAALALPAEISSNQAVPDDSARALQQSKDNNYSRALLERIADAQWKISDSIVDLNLARELLNLLRQAGLLLQAEPPDRINAERDILEVEYRINLVERAARWSADQGKKVLGFELIWLAAASGILAALPALAVSETAATAATAALIGSLGGVFAGLLNLQRHAAGGKPLNSRGNYGFFLLPVTGALLGGFLFLGFLALPQGTSSPGDASHVVLYLLSALAGLFQNGLYGLAQRSRLL